MADTILMRPAKLTLFDGGAGASAPAGGEGTGAAGQGETTAKTPGSTRRGKTGEYDNVRFGKQDVQTPLEEMEKTSLIEDENGNPVISVNGINPSGE